MFNIFLSVRRNGEDLEELPAPRFGEELEARKTPSRFLELEEPRRLRTRLRPAGKRFAHLNFVAADVRRLIIIAVQFEPPHVGCYESMTRLQLPK
ncbi:MAG TPA: hypothetical protein VNN22_03050 [Verrucomicrobiae bacterium]|nr:hypothetical protein [Verrucomicrobiae bacterium]